MAKGLIKYVAPEAERKTSASAGKAKQNTKTNKVILAQLIVRDKKQMSRREVKPSSAAQLTRRPC